MTKYYYHYTDVKNDEAIMKEGLTGTTFLCENAQDCLLFAHVYSFGQTRDVFVYKINAEVVEKDLEESFDHNPDYFKCQVFTYEDTIDPSDISILGGWTLNAKPALDEDDDDDDEEEEEEDGWV